MKITVEASSVVELKELLAQLMGSVALRVDVAQSDPIPLTPAAQAVADAPKPEPVPAEQTTPSSRLTVDQLKAGMTLKPTATSSLPDGTRISVGDEVIHGGESWVIEATYRGSIIAMNEDGRVDVLKTEDCKAAPSEPTGHVSETPKTEHVASNVSTPSTSNEKVSAQVASTLRERATELVSKETVSVSQVFDKLNSFGVQQIDGLSAGDAELFRQWLEACAAPVPAADKALGF
jgi:hypothetical protein